MAADARYEGISADGSVAFFSTVDKLVPGDTDNRRDIYERSYDEAVEGYVTRQASFGPKGGNNAFDVQFQAATADGVGVFFSTGERLTAEDKDATTDLYVRDLDANKTTLVSAGDPSCAASNCGNANSAISAVDGGVVAGGDIVFFASEEQLSTDDVDGAADVYARDLAAEPPTTVLVSAADPSCSGCGDGPVPAFFHGASADGMRAFFSSAEILRAGDGDSLTDIYERNLEAGETRLVSTPNVCPVGLDCTPVYGGNSADGLHVFFETNERISGADTDSQQDLYDWSAGVAVLASQGPSGFNGPANALFAGNSPNGESVFFETTESLVPEDTDAAQDIYERSAGTTTLISRRAASCEPSDCGSEELDSNVVRSDGIPQGVFDDGGRVFFFSSEKLVPEDDDGSFDVYVRDVGEGATSLVSQADASCTKPACGNGVQNANFAGASEDGSHAFFVTTEPLVDADADTRTDVYERSGGATILTSTGSINGNGPHEAHLHGASADGSRAFFVTSERLTGEDDFAGEEDVYLRAASGTLLVSAENDPELELGPPPPLLESTDPPSPGVSTEPMILGTEAESAAAIKIYTSTDCSGEPVATGSAEELAEPGIAVTVTAGSTTSFRATAEAEGFTSPCSELPLTYKQEDPAPPPPPSGGSGGGSSGGGGGGSSSPPPTTHSGGIAYVTPTTRITFGPASKTRARRPVFRFTDSTGQPGTRFFCRVDRRRWQGCGSPVRLRRLSSGRHVFAVHALNAIGVWEPQPSQRAFKVVPR